MSRSVLVLLIAVLILIIGIGGWMMMRGHHGRRFRERDSFHERGALEDRRGNDLTSRRENDPPPQGNGQPTSPDFRHRRAGYGGNNSETGQSETGQPNSNQESTSSIGVATMTNDGTIVMNLRTESSGGMVGNAIIQYAPSDKEYSSVLQHLGGLRPGERKMVPPWPATSPSMARSW